MPSCPTLRRNLLPVPNGARRSMRLRCRAAAESGVRGSARRGSEVLEVILALPILWIVTLALFQYGFLAISHQAIVAGVDQAAREAAKTGMTPAQRLQTARDVMKKFLAVRGIDADATTRLFLQYGPDPGADSVEYDPGVPGTLPADVIPAGRLRLKAFIRLADAQVPDWLASFGFSLAGRRFEAAAVVPLE